jgi:DNA-directed RNA polymerase subunit alpha
MLSGECEKAAALLEETRSAGEQSAHWHCAYARLCQEEGKLDDAIEHYEEAIDSDGNHARSTFHLAYLLSLRGDEEGAIELYRQCSDAPFLYADALVNLAVLYEDASKYDAAGRCLGRVLAAHPNHPRARLYLRDVEAACGMFIDDQQLREMEKHSAMLDIPVSDFELSVRSRNCLKKMNIHTLGDLMEISEAELLSYKNFGETSLREIKAMLAQKSIALGQNAESQAEAGEEGAPVETKPVEAGAELIDQPVSTLQLSVRSRKCLQRLGIATIRETIARSESELMESRNFGQTSLSEIKDCLGKIGLSLRTAD